MEVKTKITTHQNFKVSRNTKIKKIISRITLIFGLVVLISAFFNISSVLAANLYFSPSSGSYNVGNTISVGIYVSSNDQAMNAGSGIVSFPTDKLEVVSISKSGSIVSLWMQEPSYSNSSGTVKFEGIVLTPGYTGSAGKMISITFRAKAVGTATLNFSSSSVLANDGLGTNILGSASGASFNINIRAIVPPPVVPPPTAVSKVPAGPGIISLTHPDSDSWYANQDIELKWLISDDINAVRLLVSREAEEIPTVNYIPPIDSKEIMALDDGVWYFHNRLRNAYGWGETSHFRFQIDTQNPKHFKITKLESDDLTEPRVKFDFDALDEISGISHYDIQIDDNEVEKWIANPKYSYETPVLGPGDHSLVVKAVDKAGNYLTDLIEFNILPLDTPIITQYPSDLQSGDIITIRGLSYPNSQINLWLQRENDDSKVYTTITNNSGEFIIILEEKLSKGIYKIWNEVIDERGAKSMPSEQMSILVRQSEFWRIGSMAISILAIVIPLIALVFLLVFMLLFITRKLKSIKIRVNEEAREAEQVLHKEFNVLRREVRKQIRLVEKISIGRGLTSEEEKNMLKLKKELNAAEKRVEKEIRDIQKQVR